MHDLHTLRNRPPVFIEGLDKRGLRVDFAPFDILEAKRRILQVELEDKKAERNQNSKTAGLCRKNKDEAGFLAAQLAGVVLNDVIEGLENQVQEILLGQQTFALNLPNIPDIRAPHGLTEADNRVVRTVGDVNLEVLPDHQTVLEALQRLPLGAATPLSGSRFAVLEGQVARLHRALGQMMLDIHVDAGYREVSVPVLVNAQTMQGTGQLPKFADDLYQTTDGLYLIPTAEVPVTNLVAGQILNPETLPRCYTALTPCFRKEAGAAGRDVRGLIRQHQFEKVEMVRIENPEQADEALEQLVAQAEKVLKALEVPYRVIELCTGDLGFGATRTFDLEVWLPNQQAYREISSVSAFGDFQARRMQTRFKGSDGKMRFVHTLNGSGVAVGRALVALLENHQKLDGSVLIPKALVPYMGGRTILTPNL